MEEKLLHYGPTQDAWLAKYNTAEGIEQLVATLEGFHELMRERRRAGYDKEHPVKLIGFTIMGHWWADHIGNTARIYEPEIPRRILREAPIVMKDQGYYSWLLSKGIDVRDMASSTSGFDPEVALPGIECPECKKAWTMKNALDVVKFSFSEKVDDIRFIGKSLQEVEEHFRSLKDAYRTLGPEPHIRNNRFIDLNKHPEYDRPKNEKGWAGKEEGITMEYVVQRGDELSVSVTECRHKLCNQYWLIREEEAFYRRVFKSAGVEVESAVAIPNEYWQGNNAAPWFVINRNIKIGRRKRVWVLDWSDTKQNFLGLFKDEDVTKETGLIHAWTEEKLIEYVKTVYGAFAILEEN